MNMCQKALCVLMLSCAAASAQTAFDVASIKPNSAGDNRMMIRIQPGGRFSATGISARVLLLQALGARDFQIINAPGWTSADRWDVNAVSESLPERVPPDVLRPMLRKLLEDRFALKLHTETRELPTYALVVGKNGMKLKANEEAGPQRQQMMRMGRGQINAKGVTMAGLAQQLSNVLGRDVIDKTGLAGNYDVELNWTPEPGQGGMMGAAPPGSTAPPVDNSGPSIFTALQEQAGLRLESSKGPVTVYVIDNIAKPSEN